MKALILKNYKEFAYEDVPTPIPGADEVRVSVKACGICGSDVHGMDGSTGRRRPPIIMGHEAAGVIESIGSAVKHWSAGDRVTFDSTIYCGECTYCRAGRINLCDRRRVLGVSCEDYRQHGAFAEFVVVPERILYRVPEGLGFERAALVEPYSIALHAVRRSSPALNDTVVVVGAGMIGLALIQALSRCGCGQVIAVDVAEDRLALASKLGATRTINAQAVEAQKQILEVTCGKGADRAYEAVGLSSTVSSAISCVRKGGAVILVGNVTPKVELPLQTVVTRELTLFGSCASRGEYPDCLELMARNELDPGPLISAEASLSQGASWFERLYRRESGLLKVLLHP